MLPNGNSMEIGSEVNVGTDDVFGVNAAKTIHCLPVELLDMVFGCLTHTEKLIARLVCNDWNIPITKYLTKNSYFVLNSGNNHQVLLDTTNPFTRIQISGYRFRMSAQARTCISSLQLTLPKIQFDLAVCLEFLLSFPNVKNLILCTYDSIKPINPNISVSKALEQRFKEFVKNLEVLEISFQYREYVILNHLLKRIAQEQKLNLNRLVITEQPDSQEQPVAGGANEIEIPNDELPISNLHKIITSTSKSLKYLTLAFHGSEMRSKLHSELISKLFDQGKVVHLETLILHGTSMYENVLTDFEIHQKFISSQPNLKTVLLPSCADQSLCQNLVLSLPSSVKILTEVQRKHISPDFPKDLQSIEHLVINGDGPTMDSEMFSNPCPSVRALGIYHRRVPHPTGPSHRPFIENLAACFYNVVQLSLVFSKSTSSPLLDRDLQLIIENFEELRFLNICRCKNVTDFGVTGINLEYCQKILRDGSVYIGPPEFKVPSTEKVGLGYSIGSLKKLERLHIGPGTSITDVGMYYGFGFGPKLKYLHINLSTNPKVTNWGVNWLGKHNPGLEEFRGCFSRRRISSDAEEQFQKHVPLLKSTRKFAFKYVKARTSRTNP